MPHAEDGAALVIRRFVREIPESEPVLLAHLADNFDELLPYVCMADLTRWIIALQRAAGGGDEDAAMLRDRALDFLERHYADPHDAEVRNLIGGSFLENLHQAGADQQALIEHLGPTLRSAMALFGGTG